MREIYLCFVRKSSDCEDDGIYIYLQKNSRGISLLGASGQNFSYEDVSGKRQTGKKVKIEFANLEEFMHYFQRISVMNNAKPNALRPIEDGLKIKSDLERRTEINE